MGGPPCDGDPPIGPRGPPGGGGGPRLGILPGGGGIPPGGGGIPPGGGGIPPGGGGIPPGGIAPGGGGGIPPGPLGGIGIRPGNKQTGNMLQTNKHIHTPFCRTLYPLFSSHTQFQNNRFYYISELRCLLNPPTFTIRAKFGE